MRVETLEAAHEFDKLDYDVSMQVGGTEFVVSKMLDYFVAGLLSKCDEVFQIGVVTQHDKVIVTLSMQVVMKDKEVRS